LKKEFSHTSQPERRLIEGNWDKTKMAENVDKQEKTSGISTRFMV
jgi:hypothetical protein